MAYSNRPSKFADPSVSPYRNPFQPSAHREKKLAQAAGARKINRMGRLGVPARVVAVAKV